MRVSFRFWWKFRQYCSSYAYFKYLLSIFIFTFLISLDLFFTVWKAKPRRDDGEKFATLESIFLIFLYCIESPKLSKDFLLVFGPGFVKVKSKIIFDDKKFKFDWSLEFRNLEYELNFFLCLRIFLKIVEIWLNKRSVICMSKAGSKLKNLQRQEIEANMALDEQSENPPINSKNSLVVSSFSDLRILLMNIFWEV